MIVGGGPTGVEVAAELHDMIYDDLVKLYPQVIKDVCIQIVELTDHLLSTYDRAISMYTADNFKRAGEGVLDAPKWVPSIPLCLFRVYIYPHGKPFLALGFAYPLFYSCIPVNAILPNPRTLDGYTLR